MIVCTSNPLSVLRNADLQPHGWKSVKPWLKTKRIPGRRNDILKDYFAGQIQDKAPGGGIANKRKKVEI